MRFFEGAERGTVAKKSGDVDENILKQQFGFAGIFLKEAKVFFQVFDFLEHHSPDDPAFEGGEFVVGKIDAAGKAQ